MDFKNPDQVKELLGSAFSSRLAEASAELSRRWLLAENTVLIAFCALKGIDISTLYGVDVDGSQQPKMKPRGSWGKIVQQFEIVHADGEEARPGKPQIVNGPNVERVIRETWIVDRRNGYTGHDRTFPRAQMLLQKDGTIEIRIIDQEANNGTD